MMTGFEQYTRKTRRAIFLELEQVVPWREMCAGGAALSQSGERSAAGRNRANAADLLFAAVVQPLGPSGRVGAVRLRGDAAVRGH